MALGVAPCTQGVRGTLTVCATGNGRATERQTRLLPTKPYDPFSLVLICLTSICKRFRCGSLARLVCPYPMPCPGTSAGLLIYHTSINQ